MKWAIAALVVLVLALAGSTAYLGYDRIASDEDGAPELEQPSTEPALLTAQEAIGTVRSWFIGLAAPGQGYLVQLGMEGCSANYGIFPEHTWKVRCSAGTFRLFERTLAVEPFDDLARISIDSIKRADIELPPQEIEGIVR